ncbi:hypothetical protein NDU88_001592 [Pleurodeles waltl]|uniref:Uncharacterized protein n=1 Tax=Pleurodeles waltl TaxID=8319 RepID=A0AAV7Q3K6_PLEWA|nr:hypothetical protein NDU88_001592 [Pleurodeles waltl]
MLGRGTAAKEADKNLQTAAGAEAGEKRERAEEPHRADTWGRRGQERARGLEGVVRQQVDGEGTLDEERAHLRRGVHPDSLSRKKDHRTWDGAAGRERRPSETGDGRTKGERQTCN